MRFAIFDFMLTGGGIDVKKKAGLSNHDILNKKYYQ
jgi:hypothetical protein